MDAVLTLGGLCLVVGCGWALFRAFFPADDTARSIASFRESLSHIQEAVVATSSSWDSAGEPPSSAILVAMPGARASHRNRSGPRLTASDRRKLVVISLSFGAVLSLVLSALPGLGGLAWLALCFFLALAGYVAALAYFRSQVTLTRSGGRSAQRHLRQPAVEAEPSSPHPGTGEGADVFPMGSRTYSRAGL